MVDYLAPTGSLFLSFFGSAVFNYITEGRAKRKFKEAFAKYLSPQVVDEISEHLDDLKLDVGDRTEITILFSDIRGFTSMSEKLPPEEVVKRLNRYLEVMVEVIFKYGGTLDKYMGDEIMAFFGAPKADPDHAKTACLAALSMHDELERLNEELKSEGAPQMNIGIGINTGEVVVGNIGSDRRMDYTVIGDHVNLASRLQVLNKDFGTEIIISEFTAKAAGGLETRDLGDVNIRGKEKPVRILELLGVK
jgi:adenylate cyclase